MKFIIEKTNFLKLLSHANNVVERRNTLLILSNILIEADDNRIRITATDMDMEVIEEVEAQIIEAGKTTIPAQPVFEYVGKLDDGAQIEGEVMKDRNVMMLRSGKSSFTQPTMPADDFPIMDNADFTHHFSMNAALLGSIFSRAKTSMSVEETRFYLNGVFLHALEAVEEGDADQQRLSPRFKPPTTSKLRIVATDGHRMVRIETDLPDGASGMPEVIVPRKAVTDLARLLENSEDSVKIGLSNTKMQFEFDGLMIKTKLVDGKFPDYEHVIPLDNNQLLEFNRREVRNVLDRVSIAATERSKTVKMALEHGRATVSSVSNEVGHAEDELIVEFEGTPLTIGFNSRYMSDILSNLTSDQVQLLLKDESNPFIITDQADESILFLLMPLRV